MALETEFKYFLDHQDELVLKYEGKFLVIRENEVVGAFDSQANAYNDAIGKFKLGTFLIQRCIPGEAAYRQTFHSRVIFS